MEFFTVGTPLPSYIPYPRFLLQYPLNETDRLVYSLILARLKLSQSNGWVDGIGVYCRYTIKNLMADTGKSKSTIIAALANLEKQGLLHRRRAGANMLYLRVPDNCSPVVRNAVPGRTGKPAPNNKNSYLNYTYKGDSF